MSAPDWAHLAYGVAVWVIVPLAIGFLRLRRREMGDVIRLLARLVRWVSEFFYRYPPS